MKRKTLHDEQHNEDFYYESDNNGRTWHEVWPEDEESEEEDESAFSKCSECGHGMIVSADEKCPICGKSHWIDI